jgi:hypothetical protein
MVELPVGGLQTTGDRVWRYSGVFFVGSPRPLAWLVFEWRGEWGMSLRMPAILLTFGEARSNGTA